MSPTAHLYISKLVFYRESYRDPGKCQGQTGLLHASPRPSMLASISPGCPSRWATCSQLPVATPARPRRREIASQPLSRRVLVHWVGRVDACGLTCGAPVVDSAVRTGRRQGPGCTTHEAAASASQQVTGTCWPAGGCLPVVCSAGRGRVLCAAPAVSTLSPTRSKNFGEATGSRHRWDGPGITLANFVLS